MRGRADILAAAGVGGCCGGSPGASPHLVLPQAECGALVEWEDTGLGGDGGEVPGALVKPGFCDLCSLA